MKRLTTLIVIATACSLHSFPAGAADPKLKVALELFEGEKMRAGPTLHVKNTESASIKFGLKHAGGEGSETTVKITPTIQPDNRVNVTTDLTFSNTKLANGVEETSTRKMSHSMQLEQGKQASVTVGAETLGSSALTLKMIVTTVQ